MVNGEWLMVNGELLMRWNSVIGSGTKNLFSSTSIDEILHYVQYDNRTRKCTQVTDF